ncbi:SDR family oxidoreductase [Octadecabacter sp. 1_MG-2023]|uniref:SDR family oxidoreductase n=1 Tax=unclassified Octadecabacter TaxID=196158 RepID=UPI001C0A10E2|nr:MULTISPECIES: SDR family oxidoreductase [unclassified Octadecabacter]MBU2991723.1 SDR family oxidoreductase [Octadecabacter sp. B2R22]MDO6735696.1 SDR family oxidoreductase [Octadecabacter sp. 1_MG-2023]
MQSQLNAAPTDLTGKVCLVTGAAGGIGLSAVLHFAALGATVYATDIADTFDGPASYRPFNLLDEAGLSECTDWISEIKPDVLFNNAAIFDMGSVLEADLAQFDRLFGLNVRAFYAVLQASAKSMVANSQTGSIINLASQAGHRGEALVAHYCATKAAVISYTQSAALALAPHKVRVNAISPGVIDTPMWKDVDALFAKFEGKEIGQKKREVGEAVPLGHMGDPSDVARAAVFLASDQSSYMTAQTIGIDGGNVLR